MRCVHAAASVDVVESDAIAEGAVTAEKIAAQAITGDKIANLTGHSVTELDDVTDAGSGKIITDAERDKLQGLSGGGIGSTVETLNVTKHLKVGENSLHLDSSGGTAPKNHIYASGGDPLLLQANSATDGNVGIGDDDPTSKLTLSGDFLINKIPSSAPTMAKNGGLHLYSELVGTSKKYAGIASIDTVSGSVFKFFPFSLDADEIILTSLDNSSSPKMQPIILKGNPIVMGYGNVGIETSDPKNTLDVAGSVAIGSGYAGKETAPENGLLVEGKIGVGASDPRYDIHLQYDNAKIAFGDNNTLEYAESKGGANVLVGEYGTGDTDKLQLHGKKGIHFTTDNYQNGFKLEAMTILRDGNVGIGTTAPNDKLDVIGGITSRVNATQDWWNRNIQAKCNRKNMAAYTTTLNGTDTFYVACAGWIYSQGHYLGSDISLKKDIVPLDKSLAKVLQLKGISYRFKEESDNSKKSIGLVAQDAEKVVPEVVQEGRDGIKMVAYQNLVALLIEATKEQQSQFEELKAQNDALKTIVCKDHPQEAICQ